MISRRGFLQAQLAGMAVIVCNPHRLLASQAGNSSKPLPWVNYVRISGNPLRLDRVDEIIREATESHVFGIETDNDIEGRYESFLDPAEKLKAIKAVAEKAHAVGN